MVIKITEILGFIAGAAPYLFLYTALFCSTLMAIVFGISAFLSRRDGTQYEKRTSALDDNKDAVEYLQGLDVKNESTLSVVENFYNKKEKGLQRLKSLKLISGKQTKSYMIKAVICLTISVVLMGGLNFVTQEDIASHNMEGKYFITEPPYNVQTEVFPDGIKKSVVMDSKNSIKYEYVFKDVGGHYELQYADKEIILPNSISNIFKVVWLLFTIFATYLIRIMFF